jgi:hypothetical protein
MLAHPDLLCLGPQMPRRQTWTTPNQPFAQSPHRRGFAEKVNPAPTVISTFFAISCANYLIAFVNTDFIEIPSSPPKIIANIMFDTRNVGTLLLNNPAGNIKLA